MNVELIMLVLCTLYNQASSTVIPSDVKVVHLIQSNHLDLGFSDLMTRVMNRYLVGGPGTNDPNHQDLPCDYETFFGSAAKTASTLRKIRNSSKSNAGFKYMADSWVMDVFRNCPLDFPSVGHPWDPTGLVCPNASLAAEVAEAVSKGDIW
jgi:hypothetical protein